TNQMLQPRFSLCHPHRGDLSLHLKFGWPVRFSFYRAAALRVYFKKFQFFWQLVLAAALAADGFPGGFQYMSSKAAQQRVHRLVKVCSSISGWTLALFLAGSLSAQTLSSINGTVTDSSGAVVGTAKVTVTNDATHVSKTAETSSAGTYTVTDLIPGT